MSSLVDLIHRIVFHILLPHDEEQNPCKWKRDGFYSWILYAYKIWSSIRFVLIKYIIYIMMIICGGRCFVYNALFRTVRYAWKCVESNYIGKTFVWIHVCRICFIHLVHTLRTSFVSLNPFPFVFCCVVFSFKVNMDLILIMCAHALICNLDEKMGI